MGNDENIIDDLFDKEIHKSLKSLGYIFPQTIEDFKKITEELKCTPIKKPSKLEDPFSFLEKETKVQSLYSPDKMDEYKSNYAQAAREGSKNISENVKNKMKQDKANSRKSNKN
ncbi:MAG: hypothetical protein A3K10_10595 [Bacteroidetes bacterium RIFCSPLOWO2_12_FULL_31_6]|nr:MAG: hypothetical protein A3K10_10595 [Bacteroidetes bacterium RIFCSPLOWO2_12_FULL_31_6]